MRLRRLRNIVSSLASIAYLLFIDCGARDAGSVRGPDTVGRFGLGDSTLEILPGLVK